MIPIVTTNQRQKDLLNSETTLVIVIWKIFVEQHQLEFRNMNL